MLPFSLPAVALDRVKIFQDTRLRTAALKRKNNEAIAMQWVT